MNKEDFKRCYGKRAKCLEGLYYCVGYKDQAPEWYFGKVSDAKDYIKRRLSQERKEYYTLYRNNVVYSINAWDPYIDCMVSHRIKDNI